ncbi:MAG: aminotransferase class I/II-fold pyridoxal phosphate-dependent enzyme, partial [Limosilactobacillus fermentum]
MPKMNPALRGRFNHDLTSIAPSNIRTFDAEVSSIKGIVKLTLGEPDFNVPTALKNTAIQAIEDNDSHYTPSVGTAVLREAIAHFLSDRYDLIYDPATEITVTVGATEAIFASFEALLNPGDKVIIPTPTFPLYETVVQMLGATPVLVDTSATDFVLTPAL